MERDPRSEPAVQVRARAGVLGGVSQPLYEMRRTAARPGDDVIGVGDGVLGEVRCARLAGDSLLSVDLELDRGGDARAGDARGGDACLWCQVCGRSVPHSGWPASARMLRKCR